VSVTTSNSSVDDRDRRTLGRNSNCRLNYAMIVKLYHPYTHFPLTVHTPILSANRDFFGASWLSGYWAL